MSLVKADTVQPDFQLHGQILTARKSIQVIFTPVSRNLRKPDKKSPPEVSALTRDNCRSKYPEKILSKFENISIAGKLQQHVYVHRC